MKNSYRLRNILIAAFVLAAVLCFSGMGTVEAENGFCGENVTWLLDDQSGLLLISGSGAMENYDEEHCAPWTGSVQSITGVIIDSGVTSVGSRAFLNCPNLRSASIPDTVTGIGTDAFAGCGSGLTITCGCGSAARMYADLNGISVSVTHRIEDDLCLDCGMPENWIDMGSSGGAEWYLCSDGRLIVIGSGPMENYSDEDQVPWKDQRESITSLRIKSGVTGIAGFCGCTHLSEVMIPDSVTTIGDRAFCDCTDLTDIVIPDSVEEFGSDVFIGCDELTVTCGCSSSARTYAEINGVKAREIHSFEDGFCTACGTPENAAASGRIGGLRWYLTPNGHMTVYGTGEMPFYYDGIPLPWIEYRQDITSLEIREGVTNVAGFAGCGSLREVLIAEGVTVIDSFAFEDCRGLTNITIPDSVSRINNSAFVNCEWLTVTCGCSSFARMYAEEYNMPVRETHSFKNGFCTACGAPENTIASGKNGEIRWYLTANGHMTVHGNGTMTKICKGSFTPWAGYRGQITSVEIREGITDVEGFKDCYQLLEVSIANGVTSIGSSAFEGCAGLTNITIPDSVTGIEADAFYDCYMLTGITIPDSVTGIGNGAFYGCDKLTITCSCTSCARIYAEANGILLSVTHTIKNGSCTGCGLPRNVAAEGIYGEAEWRLTTDGRLTVSGNGTMGTESGSAAPWRSYRKLITRAEIREGITNVTGFEGCDQLQEVSIPNGVKGIDDRTFAGCSALTGITIPDGVTCIGTKAFADCTALTALTIPDGVTDIGYEAFDGCTALTALTIPDSVAMIGNFAFYGCDKLTITCGCTSYARTYADENRVSVLRIHHMEGEICSFCGLPENGVAGGTCGAAEWLLTDDGKMTVWGNGEMALGTDTEVPWSRYLQSITLLEIREGVTRIGGFAGCYNLREVLIPESLKRIDKGAFRNCRKMETITIPDTVKRIDENAFYGCDKLMITCGCKSYARTIANENGIPILPRHSMNGELCALCGLPENGLDEGTCGGTEWLLTNDGKMTVWGSGEMIVDPERKTPWSGWEKRITLLEIRKGVTRVAGFAGCGNLKTVLLPKGVTRIDDAAFSGCTTLMNITIPDGVTHIGSRAFEYCNNLTSLPIPDSVTGIGENAFRNCSSLTAVCGCTSCARTYAEANGIPLSVTHTLENGFCAGCGLPENCVAKGAYGAIEWQLTTDGRLTVCGSGTLGKDSAGTAPWDAYRGLITSAEIGEGITGIDATVFAPCGKLTKIRIPDSVTAINGDTFIFNRSLEITCGCGSYAQKYADTNGIFMFPIHHMEGELCSFCGLPENVAAWGTCGEIGWTITNDGKMTVSGSGELTADTDIGSLWKRYREHITLLEVGEGVTRIGGFTGCYALREILIPDSLKRIDKEAFRSCRNLEKITIPDNVRRIDENAFYGCAKLTITCSCNSYARSVANSYGIWTSLKHSMNGELCAICGLPENGLAGGKCGGTEWLLTNDGKMTVWGSGEMTVDPDMKAPWSGYQDRFTRIEIREGVTRVGGFAGCVNLKTVLLPESLKRIDKEAFADCHSLETITIPDSVERIDENVFRGGARLTITCGCSSCARSYAGSYGIPTVLLHEEVVDPALPPTRSACGHTGGSHCGKCGEVLTQQEEIAPFKDIPVLFLPESLKAVADEAFMGSAVECAVLPEGCESIGSKAFADCGLLKLAEIPLSVTVIADDAFEGSGNAVIVTASGSAAEAYAAEHGMACVIQ